MPQHTHAFNVSSAAATGQHASTANDSVLATASVDLYQADTGDTPLDAATISTAGGGQPHNNMQPTVAVNFCIALQGVFPSRS